MIAIEGVANNGQQWDNERPTARLIKRLQHESGIGRSELAHRLGVDPSLITMVCSGRRGMGGKLLRALLKAYPESRDEIIETFLEDEEGIE